jgi:hypothetical protein
MADWSRTEVEASGCDHFDMLALELSGASRSIKRSIIAISFES